MHTPFASAASIPPLYRAASKAPARMQRLMVVWRFCDTRTAALLFSPARLSGPLIFVRHSVVVAAFDALPCHSSACLVAARISSAAAVVLPVAGVTAAAINREGVWVTSGGLW